MREVHYAVVTAYASVSRARTEVNHKENIQSAVEAAILSKETVMNAADVFIRVYDKQSGIVVYDLVVKRNSGAN